MKTYEPESEWLIDHTCIAGNFRTPAGVYVDLGCSHPTNKSLTAFVRDLGWRGVAIDGNPDYLKDWEAAGFKDHFFCGILSDKPFARFAIHDNSFTSRISASAETDRPERWGINRIVEEDTMPLNWILESRGIGKIDLLTVDLEGMEAKVLATLDWEKHQPSFVVVEFMTSGEGVDGAAANLLIEKGYELVQMFSSNLIFRRK